MIYHLCSLALPELMLPWYLCIAISKIAAMETLKALNHDHFVL